MGKTRKLLLPGHGKENFMPLIVSIVQREYRKSPVLDYDDAMNSAVVGLMQASKRFRRNGGASLKTFAYRRIQGAVRDAEGKQILFENRHELVDVQELNDRVVVGGLENRVARRELIRKVRKAIKRLCSDEEQVCVLDYYLEERPDTDIAAELGKTPQMVKATRARVLDRIRCIFAGAE